MIFGKIPVFSSLYRLSLISSSKNSREGNVFLESHIKAKGKIKEKISKNKVKTSHNSSNSKFRRPAFPVFPVYPHVLCAAFELAL